MARGRKKGDGLGKTGGRKKGSVNRVTRERRELIESFLDAEWPNFQEMYRRADDETKLKIYMEMIPYTTPKMASIEYKEKRPAKTYKDELDEMMNEK